MAETLSMDMANAPARLGLLSRAVGVVLSPRETFAAIAAHPRVLGILVLAIGIMAAAQFVFLSTEAGQNAVLDQQLEAMRAFGITITDEMLAQMEARMGTARYTSPLAIAVILPVGCAIFAGLLLAVFTAIMGGDATYKQVYAVVAHSLVIGALQQIFSMPIQYAQESMASPTRMAIFFPMLEETSFFYYLLSYIDLFYIWSTIVTAIGIAVLYKRRTGPVATILLGLYGLVVVIIAAVRAA